jgi:uncharacterized caspase-like protein
MPSRRVAILVGINKYDRCGQLNFAVQDVDSLREILVDPQRGGYEEGHVKVLTDKNGLTPNAANIRRTIKTIARATESGDHITFYFSGHGMVAGEQAYLLPAECYPDDTDSCIPIGWIQSQLEESKASGKLVIMDACHSGLELGKPASGSMTPKFEAAVKAMSEVAGLVVLSSCMANERSIEDPKLEHGVFSYYLAEGLKGPADSDGDFDISAFEAYEYASRKVKEWTIKNNETQTPTILTRIAGEMTVVAVPRPNAPSTTSGAGVISAVRVSKLFKGSTYHGGRDYDDAQKSTDEACREQIGRLGAIIAGFFGPESISSVDTLTKSYGYGSFGGELLDRGNGFDYRLSVSTESDFDKSEPLFVGLLDQYFPFLDYQITAPINLLKLYKLLDGVGFKITGYDPPNLLVAEYTKWPHGTLRATNTPVDSAISVILMEDHTPDEGLISQIIPSGIQKTIASCQ